MYVKNPTKIKRKEENLMLQLERQQKILRLFKRKTAKATTNEAQRAAWCIDHNNKNRFNQMDKEKLLTKTHGGAIYKDKTHDMTDLTSRAYLFHDRALENKEAKEEIANEAIKLVSDHMCIFP